ncbi:YebC/PmpR family DNA-binding transcriptional regulator [[Mycoplasma] mobile]|uniref:Probable transcriptional regulatory protein MMOB1910 n=1 Tax=Mycoplasma mobile (strain ATCC 43663 / 163K / NCTC 11711) TaxID=267748 RepID=Y1910_MYCM1|nr:YebC/PmpR family DNA-binding transcriptional regulator [[Mycoplasma] mobile]Q6KI99.1 RecName: Full=Probable transcriptional regulatory protein MMOB1910 [Mycoplasma mobile 163K]AAT27677.1 conserved expressed protein [Mycoplasma mobile 163K]
MAGHSKWANIKHRKGAQDAARSKIFMKLSKEIFVAASGPGGADPETNPSLRLAVSKAKAQSMPKANIEKALSKASGNSKNASEFKELIYSGSLPGGAIILVICLTDNLNRAISNIKAAFSKIGGQLGKSGSIPYIFERKGVLDILKEEYENSDQLMLEALDAGAEDVQTFEDFSRIITNPSNFQEVKDKIDKALSLENYATAEIQYLPNTTVSFEKEKLEKLETWIETLEDNEDVQEIYHNIDF